MSSKYAKSIHSINIHGYNTWDDWHLIPSSRPVVAPPAKKRITVSVPYGDGIIDESESLTKYPLYEVRTGQWEFIVANGYLPWEVTYSKIADAIHGIQCTVILDDDPSWYYTGTVAINEWRSDKNWSKIVINYELYPYKLSINKSTDTDWLWDPFNFDTDVIYSNAVDGLGEITVDTDNYVEYEFTNGYFGRKPVSPKIAVKSGGPTFDVHLTNPELGILGPVQIISSNTPRLPNFVFSTINYNNVVKLKIKGHGTVSFDFRVGRL